jgi:hypothetical protein
MLFGVRKIYKFTRLFKKNNLSFQEHRYVCDQFFLG